ncbi:UNVERIFIED_CONTAM: hypothetical protein GTU68_009958 [Idotea baltica]|nr:hypothetical protein [Idotea baltica]
MKSQIKNYIFKTVFFKVMRKLRMLLHLRKTWVLAIILITFVFYVFKNSGEDNLKVVHKCEVTSEQKLNLFNLLKRVSATLEKLKVSYFLCYISLWGAIQESGPLPWDTNAELCILSSNLLPYDEASIHRAFQRQELSLEYKSSEGEYIVKNSSVLYAQAPQVKLILFEADSRVGGMFRRVGWKRRLLPPDCDAHPDLQCFPPHLINSPLPKKSFGPLNLPGPREDIDLLKFHYPDTWWKPLKPNCQA